MNMYEQKQKTEERKTKPSCRKKGAAAVSLLIVAALLFTGTWAWKSNLLHKTTVGLRDVKAVLKSVQLVDESKNEDAWALGGTVSKRIFVKNDGLDGSGGTQGNDRFEDVYVRITLKEYMERLNAGQEHYGNRLMLTKDGDFIELDDNAVGASGTEALESKLHPSSGAYKGYTLVKLHNALKYKQNPNQTAWYIETRKGDSNGQYGNFMTTKLTKKTEHIDMGAWKDGSAKAQVPAPNPQTPGDYHKDGTTEECKYEKINWAGAKSGNYQTAAGYTNANTKLFREYIKLQLEGSDKVRFLSDYAANSGSAHAGQKVQQGAYWLIDDQKDMCAYWMQPIEPGAGNTANPNPKSVTADFTAAMILASSPNGKDGMNQDYPLNFYYALHADMDPTLKANYKTDWPGMDQDIENAIFSKTKAKGFKISFVSDSDRTTLTSGTVIAQIHGYGTQEYSLDDGMTWLPFSSTGGGSPYTFNVPNGEILFRGTGKDRLNYQADEHSMWKVNPISGSKAILSGDLSMLLDYQNPPSTIRSPGFYRMFEGNTGIVSAADLEFPTADFGGGTEGIYVQMFQSCTNLEYAPKVLPTTRLSPSCYKSMFSGCTNLKTAPELPATTLAWGCYERMFESCSALTTAPPELPATTLEGSCYSWMFANCGSLKAAPYLAATRPGYGSCKSMFFGCIKLNSISVGLTDWRDSNGSIGTDDWMLAVSNSGTFNCPATLDTSSPSHNTNPVGWTVTHTP